MQRILYKPGVARPNFPSPSGLFDDVRHGAVDETQHLGALRRWDFEFVQSGMKAANENPPIAFVDPHPLMGKLHLATDVINRAVDGDAQKVDDQLLSRRTPSFPRFFQKRASCGSAFIRAKRSSHTAEIAS